MTTAPRVERYSGDSQRGVLLLVVALMLSILLASLSQTVLGSALPTVVGELGGVDQMMWVLTAYLLATTITMPIYGKLGDEFGRKPLLIVAITLFMVGSTIGGVASTMQLLIIGRVVQGLGGGGLMVLAQAIIADVVPARSRGVYMGWMSAAFAVSSVAGPLLGGWFTEEIGWRWTFWINLPLGILALAGALAFLRLPRRVASHRGVDAWGMALLAVATTCTVLVFSWGGNEFAWNSPVLIALAVVGVAAAGAFVVVERRTAHPLMPPQLFRDRNFVVTTIAGLVAGLAMFSVAGYLPSYLQMGFLVGPTAAGLLMVPMAGAILLTSVASGAVVKRTGRYKWMPITGAGVTALGLVLVGTTTLETPLWVLSAALGVVGMGLGALLQLLVLIMQNSVPGSVVGIATASSNFFRLVGGVVGLAVIGSLFAARLAEGLGGGSNAAQANSLTPADMLLLPEGFRVQVQLAYSEALMPLFLTVVPFMLLSVVILFFVQEKPLSGSLERDIVTDAVAEGQLLFSSDAESEETDE